uniref:c-type cytochrome n=1 Tax=Caballeronia glebae TaxID=1777143 RepID=UPI0038B7755D
MCVIDQTGRGGQVFAQHCALCHGADVQGQSSAGKTIFPPLWGGELVQFGVPGCTKYRTLRVSSKQTCRLAWAARSRINRRGTSRCLWTATSVRKILALWVQSRRRAPNIKIRSISMSARA